MKKIIFALLSIVALASCGGNESTSSAEAPKQDSIAPQVCTYSYDSSATEVGFGAFKFTEKKEVKGSFLKFTIDSTKEVAEEYYYTLFEGAQFKIDVASLDTKDQGRDLNIKSAFFGKMDSTLFIVGKVVKVKWDGLKQNGEFFINLKMNGIENMERLQFNLVESTVEIKGSIDLNYYKAQKALASLNNTCKDLHKGSDGKSVTWPEVNIYVSTKLKKNCK